MFYVRENIVVYFKEGIFPYKGNVFKIKEKKPEEESEEKSEEEERVKKFIEYIENEWKGINYDLFKDYFSFAVPNILVKRLYETKNKNKNNKLVNELRVD